MTHQDLVVVSLEPWDDVWRRNQHLVAGLLRARDDVRVLFVEPPADPLHGLRRGARPRTGRGLRPAQDSDGGAAGRLWMLQQTKWLPRRVDPHGDERRAGAVMRTARVLGMTDPTLWVNDPAGATLLRRSGWRSLYDITDDWLLAQRSPRQLAALRADEQLLLEQCAEVVVCSPALAATKGEVRPVTLIGNAVDVDLYRSPQPRPADLPSGRCAVYLGTVHRDRMDIELCAHTAERLAADGSHLVLVGPAPLDRSDIERLERAGAVLLGPRPSTSVPAYLQHADALVVPHLVDDFTDSLDPIKLYEYLAVGRPVLSTPVAGFRDSPSGLVRIAAPGEFPGVVAEMLSGPRGPANPTSEEPRIPRWSDRVQEMAAVLERVTATPSTPTPR